MQINFAYKLVNRSGIALLGIFYALPVSLYASTEITPRITATQTLFSNTTIASDENGQLTSISPGFIYQINQHKSQFLFDYTFNQERYTGLNIDKDEESHNLSMLYNITHISDHWTSQVLSNIIRASVSSDGVQSFDSLINATNTKELRTSAVKTELTRDFQQIFSLNTQLLADYADFEDLESTDSVGFKLFLDNKLSLKKLFWRTELSSIKTNSSVDSEQLNSILVGLNYRFTTKYSAFINSKVDDTSDDKLYEKATIVGLNWFLHRNSFINIGAGVRGSDNSYSLSSRFNRKRLELSVNYNETVTSSRNEVITQFADETGVINTFQSLNIIPVLQKKTDVKLLFTGKKSSLSVSYSSVRKIIEDTDSPEENTKALNLSLYRKLSFKSSVEFKYQVQDSRSSEENEVTDFRFVYNRNMSKKMKLIAELIHSTQDSNILENEYDLKMFKIGISTAF